MIKFHYHRAPRDIARLGVRNGDRMCHVYSDGSRDELESWGRRQGWRAEWIHDSAMPHFDAFGERLEVCGPGVERRELVADIRAWRRQ